MAMIQQLVVVLAVLSAAAYTGWSMTPSRTRFALLSRLDAALARREQSAGHAGLLRTRLVAPLLRRALPAGGCSSCGADKSAAPPGPPQGLRRP